ncbi:CoA transferase [Verticiella sediminum]|nr:CoA transferase [Verticiella sediminum]
MSNPTHDETRALEAREAVKALLAPHQAVPDELLSRLRLHGSAQEFDSPHKLVLASASAVGAFALGVEQYWRLAGGPGQSIGIDWMQAASGLNPGHFQTQSGYALPALSLLTELKADFYETADGRWFFPIGSYPHLRDGVLELLDCANTQTALAAGIGRWRADDLEQAFAERKLPGVYARSQQEWLAHPQGSLLAQVPPISLEKIGDSAPEPPRLLERPLQALRVLDMGHVIAGPVVARTLAEHGADVLRIGAPTNQDPFRQTVDTNIGKRSAFLDLDVPLDHAKVRELMTGADVIVQSWRPGSLERRGLGAADAAALRPGVIYVSVSAFGDEGAWRERGGFEQLGQAVSGVTVREAVGGRPRVVPTYLLNDYLSGYLGAAGVMQALMRRATEGGSYHVRVSLARTSMWVQDLGLLPFDAGRGERRHFADGLRPVLQTRESAYGPLRQLPPIAQFSHTPARWDLPPAPNGAHAPAWRC